MISEWNQISVYTLEINSQVESILGRPSFKKTIYGRGRLATQIDLEIATNKISRYDRIILKKSGNIIHEGVILEINYPIFLTSNTPVHVSLICSDNTEIANRITINDVYENTDTLTLITELVTDFLIPEGCSIGSIQISVLAISRIVWGDIQLDKIIDEIAEISGAYWFIDKDRKFYMRGFDIINPSVIPEIGINFGEEISMFQPTRKGVAYRNRQILNGGLAKTDQLTQAFAGDDENQTFTLDFIIKEIISITLNGSPVTISERSENLTTDYYYTFREKQVTQEFSDTPLSDTDSLEIVYIGFFKIRSLQEDAVEIASRAVITASSGLVSYAATDKSIEDIDTSVLRTIALLQKYLEEDISVNFRIYENSSYDIFAIEQGQTFVIDNAKLQIESETMLIIEANFTIIQDAGLSFVDIQAVDLTSINSVVNQFLQINKDSTKIEINQDEVIIQSINIEEIIEMVEEIEIIRGNALICGMDQAICGAQITAIYSLGNEV